MEGKLEPLKDYKDDIKFWLDALNNPNLNNSSIDVINEALQQAIIDYMNPKFIIKMNTEVL